MKKKTASTLMLILLLIGMLTLSFDIREVESLEPPQAEWTRAYGGTEDDFAHSMVQTLDGGYAVAGSGFANLMKIDSHGNPLWNKSYVEIDIAYSVVQTFDGGYALAGSPPHLIKTDAIGSLLWSQNYGEYTGSLCSVVVTSDRGYALAGYYQTGAGTGSSFSLAKTDENGNIQWSKYYQDSFPYINNWPSAGVVETVDGGYAIAGVTESDEPPWDADFWLVKTNSTGDMEWNQRYGGTDYDGAYSIIQTEDGGYALAGCTGGDSFGAEASDFWLVKTDSNGNMQWNRTYGGTNLDWTRSVVQTSDGGYALAGYTESYGAGDNDFWLVKTDASGNMQWNRTYGGASVDSAGSVVQTSDGGYAIAGSTRSFGAGWNDFWLVKVAPWMPPISATIDVAPDTLHLMSQAQWITCYIELPEGYNVDDVDVPTILLNNTIPVDPEAPTQIGDYDSDDAQDLMVKFDRAMVSEYILSKRITDGYVTLMITGEVNGAPFRGEDTIKVLMTGGGTRGSK